MGINKYEFTGKIKIKNDREKNIIELIYLAMLIWRTWKLKSLNGKKKKKMKKNSFKLKKKTNRDKREQGDI